MSYTQNGNRIKAHYNDKNDGYATIIGFVCLLRSRIMRNIILPINSRTESLAHKYVALKLKQYSSMLRNWKWFMDL